MKKLLSGCYLVCASLIIASCSSPGQRSVPAATAGSTASAQSLTVTVNVPQVSTGSAARQEKFVSPNTQSAKFLVTPIGNATILANSVVNCASVCTASIAVPSGDLSLSVTLYAGQNASGSVLSTGNTTTTIKSGINNQLTLALRGIVQSLQISLTNPAFAVGSAADSVLTIHAFDASNAQIIGSVALTKPITVSIVGDNANELSLSRTTIISPEDADTTVHFNGGTLPENAELQASIAQTSITSTLAVTLQKMTSEVAQQSDAFVDSIGINTHFSYNDTAYASNYTAVRQLLLNSGIRHIRDSLVDTQWQPYYDHLSDLAMNGIKATLVSELGQSASFLQTYPLRVPGVIEAYEAPNEMNLSGDVNWKSDAANFQRTLYQAVKNGALTSSFPVIGPSLTTFEAYSALGSLNAYMDYGNMHNYFGGNQPGTAGSGYPEFESYYGSIAWWKGTAGLTSGNKPVISTETGYCTAPNTQDAVSLLAQAKYISRMFLEQWLAGVKRTIGYELMDDGAGCDGTYGLLQQSGVPKAAYYALSGMIATLRDPGSSFTPSSLNYSLNVSSPLTHHLLLQKHDGTYELLIWLEAESWNTQSHADVTVPTETANLTLLSSPLSSKLTTFGNNGLPISANAVWNAHTITLPVTDSILILSLKQ